MAVPRSAETRSRILSPQEAPVPPMAVAPLGQPQDMPAAPRPPGDAKPVYEHVDFSAPPDMSHLADMGVDVTEENEIGINLEKAGKALAGKANKVSQVPPVKRGRKKREVVAEQAVEDESDDDMTVVGIELPQGTYLCSYPEVIISHGSCVVLGYNPEKVKSPMFVPKRGSDLTLSIDGKSYKVTDIGARFKLGENVYQVLVIPPPDEPAEEE